MAFYRKTLLVLGAFVVVIGVQGCLHGPEREPHLEALEELDVEKARLLSSPVFSASTPFEEFNETLKGHKDQVNVLRKEYEALAESSEDSDIRASSFESIGDMYVDICQEIVDYGTRYANTEPAIVRMTQGLAQKIAQSGAVSYYDKALGEVDGDAEAESRLKRKLEDARRF